MSEHVIPNDADRHRRIRRVLLIEGLSDVFFLVVKVVVGLQTGSTAILSDAVHSLTDLTNNVVGFLFLRVASAPPDREHPYGHNKFEALAVFGIAVAIVLMAIQVLVRAFTSVRAEIDQSPVGLALMGMVLVVNIGFTAWEHRQAHRLDSDLLRADATHTLSDVAITVAVIGGWQIAVRGHTWIDTVLAVAVAAFVIWLAYTLFRRSIPVLVDQTVADADGLEALVASIDGVRGVTQIRSHQAGSEKLVEVVVTVHGGLSTTDSHAIADEIERRVGEQIGGVRVQVHVEPAA